jgi:hypothetical protein
VPLNSFTAKKPTAKLGLVLFMSMMSFIIKNNWIYIARCSIIHLSPLFSSKEIDSAHPQRWAFFCPFVLSGIAQKCLPPCSGLRPHTSWLFPAPSAASLSGKNDVSLPRTLGVRFDENYTEAIQLNSQQQS